jgi:hypothetical protein
MTEQQRESDLELAMQMLEEYNEVFTEGKLDLQ